MATERGHTLVDVGGCRCPGSPHTTDTVELRPEITNPMGIAALYVINTGTTEGKTEADLRGELAQVYLHQGIIAWTFTDAEHRPVPITPANIDRLLPFHRGGMKVAQEADRLYSEDLLGPLAAPTSTSSPPTSTDDSTSATPPPGSPPLTPSRRSSRTSTDGRLSGVPA